MREPVPSRRRGRRRLIAAWGVSLGGPRIRPRGAAWLIVVGLATLAVSACGPNKVTETTTRTTVLTNPIDLRKLDCPSDTVKVIIAAVKQTVTAEFASQGSQGGGEFLDVICIGRQSGSDVILDIKYTRQASGQVSGPDATSTFMVGPDASGNLAQLEATLGPGGFTAVSGVGSSAASVVENVDNIRTITLYVQQGAAEFHISVQSTRPDASMQNEEKGVALLLLPQLPPEATPGAATPSVDPNDITAFIQGDYAATLLTDKELTATLKTPVLPLISNGGRNNYAPGIDVSNATTHAQNGSGFVQISVFRAATGAAAHQYFDSIYGPEINTKNSIEGLGDAAFVEPSSNRVFVLRGREIAQVDVSGGGTPELVGNEKALAALIAPRLLTR
jgi:hypothetical protein